MSKRKTDWEELNRNKKARLDKIGSFWKNHYKFNVNDNSKLEASEVYQLFVQLNPGIDVDIVQFMIPMKNYRKRKNSQKKGNMAQKRVYIPPDRPKF